MEKQELSALATALCVFIFFSQLVCQENDNILNNINSNCWLDQGCCGVIPFCVIWSTGWISLGKVSDLIKYSSTVGPNWCEPCTAPCSTTLHSSSCPQQQHRLLHNSWEENQILSYFQSTTLATMMCFILTLQWSKDKVMPRGGDTRTNLKDKILSKDWSFVLQRLAFKINLVTAYHTLVTWKCLLHK